MINFKYPNTASYRFHKPMENPSEHKYSFYGTFMQ
jgi:hypothetical protein